MSIIDWLDPIYPLVINKYKKIIKIKKCDYCGLPSNCYLCFLITHCPDDKLSEMILLYSEQEQISIVRKTSEFIKQNGYAPNYKIIDSDVKNVNLSLLEYIHHLDNGGPEIENLKIFFTKYLDTEYLIQRTYDDTELSLDLFLKKDEQLDELETIYIETKYIFSDKTYFTKTLLSTYKNMLSAFTFSKTF